jgi:hypothetical protein
MSDDQARKESTAKSKPPEGKSPTGISRKSNEGQFHIGDREKALLKELFDWSERSSLTNWVLDRPRNAH